MWLQMLLHTSVIVFYVSGFIILFNKIPKSHYVEITGMNGMFQIMQKTEKMFFRLVIMLNVFILVIWTHGTFSHPMYKLESHLISQILILTEILFNIVICFYTWQYVQGVQKLQKNKEMLC